MTTQEQTERIFRRKEMLISERRAVISYMNAKVVSEDWHGVSDAANDLRDIDSELDGMNLCLTTMVEMDVEQKKAMDGLVDFSNNLRVERDLMAFKLNKEHGWQQIKKRKKK